MDVSSSDFGKCMVRGCGKGFYFPKYKITRERYLIEEWGSMERFLEWQKMFMKYWLDWVKKDNERKKNGC